MDYGPMIAFHQQRRADVTLGAVVVPIEEGYRFGILETDAEGRVLSFEEKPKEPRGTLGSMGIYVFDRDTLARVLIADPHPRETGGSPPHTCVIPKHNPPVGAPAPAGPSPSPSVHV